MLHDKIVAFLKLGAAQNKKKLNMVKKQQQNFWTSNYSFFYILQLFHPTFPVKNVISKLILFVLSGYKNVICNECFGAFLV